MSTTLLAQPRDWAEDINAKAFDKNEAAIKRLVSAGDDKALVKELEKQRSLLSTDYAFALLLKDTPRLTRLVENGLLVPPPSAVAYAAKSNNLPLVTLLLEMGFSPDSRVGLSGTWTIEQSQQGKGGVAYRKKSGILYRLVGPTPLYYAIRHGNAEMTKLLLKHQADPDLTFLPEDSPAPINETTKLTSPRDVAQQLGTFDLLPLLRQEDLDASKTDTEPDGPRGGSLAFQGLFMGLPEGRGRSRFFPYLRFFLDGTVINVTSSGTPEQIAGWFNERYANSGAYVRSGNSIRLSVTDTKVDVNGRWGGFSLNPDFGHTRYFQGTLQGSTLSLYVYSYRNFDVTWSDAPGAEKGYYSWREVYERVR